MDRYDGFAAFVEASTPSLARTAYLLTGDRQLAEDLLQSAYAKAARHWRRIADGQPTAYVRRILYTEHVSWWRRRRLVEHASADPPAIAQPDGTDDVALRLTLQAALRRLPPKQRAVILLRYFDDLTEPQAASVLGCSVGTVKSQHHAALAKLRDLVPELAAELGIEPDDRMEVAR